MKKIDEVIELEALLEEQDDYESPYKFTHYGVGFGYRFQHPLYDEYLEKIDKALSINENYLNEKEIQDIIETLEKSLKNGKDFYTNAKPYMKEKMEEYNKVLEEGTLF